MKAVIQRCRQARVEVDGSVVGEIAAGLAIFLGIAQDDDEMAAQKLARKIAALRIFSNDEGKFDLSLREIGGAALVISNFTVCGETRKGNRPSFSGAARPEAANRIYQCFVTLLQEEELSVECGIFAADMKVTVENDGPVTLIIEV